MIKVTVNAVKKHPSLIVLIGIIMLAAACFNMFIPIFAMIIGIINMTGGGFFDSVLAVMQMLIDPQNIPVILITVTVTAILLSVLIGLLLPGYLLTVSDGLSDGMKKKGLIRAGIKKYFFKFFLISIRTTFLTVLLMVFLLVSSVPAIVITRLTLSSRPDMMIAAVFVDILTGGVVFTGLSFYSIYVYMWYIASLTASKKPFKAGKAAADHRFWNIALGLLAFDAVFTGGILIIYMIGNQALRYFSAWVFTTAIFTVFAVYLVKYFRDNSQLTIGKA